MFITFEGIDGSGKTTQARKITDYLREQGYDVILTREPGGTDISLQIREILLDTMTNVHMHPRTELLLFCASRAQLVEEVIRPFVAQGGVVLCDRYADSTLAYQGYGHGLDLAELQTILDFATGGLSPDLTLYLELPPEKGLMRRKQGTLFGEEWNRLDNMKLGFHRRVYKGYSELMKRDPRRWARVDADQDPDQVTASIINVLKSRLPQVARKVP